jgi:hypothetical protein
MDPIRIPFSVGPDLIRSTALFSTRPSASLRERKLTEFNGPLGTDLIGATDDAADGIQLLAAHLGHSEASLEELALSCAEDIALLHRGVLKAIAFAFPSGFRPTAKLGLDFASIHAPTAMPFARLVRASARLCRDPEPVLNAVSGPSPHCHR